MRKAWTLLVLSVLIAGTGLFVSSQDASAAFHIMRIHGVMGGANGDANIQFVELRMADPGQNFVDTHDICFFNASGAPVARFTFPSSVGSGADEASILVGTTGLNSFDSNWAVGSPDFPFAGNTVAIPSGLPVTNPVPAPAGKVSFGSDFATAPGDMCGASMPSMYSEIDWVAYGIAYTGTVQQGAKFGSDLPTAGIQSIKVQGPAPVMPANGSLCFPGSFFSNCSVARDNSVDYAIVSTNGAGNQPRNNANQTGPVAPADADGDGVPDPSDNCPATPNPTQVDADGDAVGDACDLCPGTAPSAQVDVAGCSQAQVDVDADGFCDPGAPSGGPGPCTGTDNCPSISNPTQGDADSDTLGDACDSDADNDGYENSAESGQPLCGNGKDDDDKTGAGLVADDGIIDDGCPGGPAQAGLFSEAQFKIGTNQLGPCSAGVDLGESPSWGSDFTSGGVPDSTDKINVLDLVSFIAPPEGRKLGTSPGQANFNSRWDLSPGRSVFNDMINVTDLTALIAGSPGFPPMFGGARAFNGPMCVGA